MIKIIAKQILVIAYFMIGGFLIMDSEIGKAGQDILLLILSFSSLILTIKYTINFFSALFSKL